MINSISDGTISKRRRAARSGKPLATTPEVTVQKIEDGVRTPSLATALRVMAIHLTNRMGMTHKVDTVSMVVVRDMAVIKGTAKATMNTKVTSKRRRAERVAC